MKNVDVINHVVSQNSVYHVIYKKTPHCLYSIHELLGWCKNNFVEIQLIDKKYQFEIYFYCVSTSGSKSFQLQINYTYYI